MSFCENCFKGMTHDGTPEGETGKIGGITCYIATPTVDYPNDKVVLFLTDVFGLGLKNSLLLSDDFARNGFMTIIPDLFNGDPYPVTALDPGAPPFDRERWWSAHGQAQIRPRIDSVLTALKLEGVAAFAATGYCLGARYVVDLAFDDVIKVSAISHPGRLVVPDDLEKYAAVSKAPLLINSCTDDRAFPLEAQAQADTILGGGKFSPGYHREYFEGCSHGFAVRGDLCDPKVKAGREGAFKACVEWFLKYL
ncbi:dienelactone hydrolase endo-1,3,1,4-beta-D-glucanase [Mycena crocata]|nr:dienelactone hydrolase endo-1,3,1,4-beta-D-glucanase [Mycena crocata]